MDNNLKQELRERFNPDGSLLRRQQLRMLELLEAVDLVCKKYDIPVILDSDAHSIDKIASRQYSMELVREVNFPDELIINYHPDRLRTYLNKYRKS